MIYIYIYVCMYSDVFRFWKKYLEMIQTHILEYHLLWNFITSMKDEIYPEVNVLI